MGEQMVRYYGLCKALHNGYYSNVCRGGRKRKNCDETDFIIEGEKYKKGLK